MKRMRKIIRIDEEKCDGCGQCILACAEGALALVDGKARLVGEVYCDGIGACIGQCPQGALTIVERNAQEFDEEAVKKHLRTAAHSSLHSGSEQEDTLACGCPSSVMTTLNRKQPAEENNRDSEAVSELGHWPVKLQLLGPDAAFLKGADLVLLADCAAAAHPDLHSQVLRDHAVAMGCPKLDNLEAHIIRLSEILERAVPRSLTVVHMEVPCCRAFLIAAREAVSRSGIDVPLSYIVIGRDGSVIHEGASCSPCAEHPGIVTLTP